MPEAMAITAQELDELYHSLQERQAKEGVVCAWSRQTKTNSAKGHGPWRIGADAEKSEKQKGGAPPQLFSALF